MAGSLADAIAIEELGKKYNTPWFSSSSTRFGPTVQGIKGDAKVGPATGALRTGARPPWNNHTPISTGMASMA